MDLCKNLDVINIGGNANKHDDADGSLRKSCLFFVSLLCFLNETLESNQSKIRL